MSLTRYSEPASSVGAGAIYPATFGMMEALEVTSRFDDPIKLFKPVGDGWQSIMIPRTLAPEPDPEHDHRDPGVPVSFKSTFEPRNEHQHEIVSKATPLVEWTNKTIIGASGDGAHGCAGIAAFQQYQQPDFT